MRLRAIYSSLFLAAFLLGAPTATAQETDPAPPEVSAASRAQLESGIEAFRDERFEEARVAFERAIEQDPGNAEAHYMLSRIYYETPLFDKGEAGREIGEARKLDPSNVEYMVAQLQQLRLPSWSNVAEFFQQEQRRTLAEQILSVDSTNAFAHEELGALYIRDFWQYRNAIAFPTLDFDRNQRTLQEDEELGDKVEGAAGSQTLFEDPEAASSRSPAFELGDPSALRLSDRFAVETLRDQGAAVFDLSSRADEAFEAAIGHLEKALVYDPRRRPVYDHLVRIHTLNGSYHDALDVLDRMYVFFPEDAQMWSYLGLANHRVGRSDAAAKSFEQAFEFMTEDERASFEDLSLLLTEADRAQYREDPVGFASRYWTSQNPRYLTPYNERKLEHYARLVHADLLYAAEDIGLRGWDTQRGRILVRYGPPASDVVVTGDFGEVIAAFGLAADAAEVESGRQFGERFDMADRSNLFNIWDYGDFKFVFEDPLRNGEYRFYSPPADFFADASAGFVERMDYEMVARAKFREEPERYEYRPPGRDVRIPYLVHAFKGDDGRTDLYVPYGIPLGDGADTSSDLVPLTVKTGAFLIDDATRDVVVERRRTLYGLRTAQVVSFEEARLWTDTQPMEARPGPATVSVEFETAGGGAEAAQRRSVEVPDFHGDDLALSDVMFAYQVEEDFEGGDEGVSGGRLRRGDFVIQPAPWSVFSNAQPIYLYFETYGLDQNGEGQNQYAVEVTLKPKDTSGGIARLAKRVFGGDDGGVAVEFEAGGTGSDDATYTILDAAEQEPGLYTLTLRVRDTLNGRTAERTSDLYLE